MDPGIAERVAQQPTDLCTGHQDDLCRHPKGAGARRRHRLFDEPEIARSATGVTALPDIDAFIAVASELAEAAGAVIRPYFRTALAIEDKPDHPPVTAADQAAERTMRGIIER